MTQPENPGLPPDFHEPLDPREGPHGTTRPMKAVAADAAADKPAVAFPEAYLLMTYASKDRTVIKSVWNSRDGTTLEHTSVAGKAVQHVDWECDVRAPLHVPNIGDLIWVDLDEERRDAASLEVFEEYWEKARDVVFKVVKTITEEAEKDEVATAWVAEFARPIDPGEPVLVAVTAEMQQAFYRHRSENHPLLKSVMEGVGSIDKLAEEIDKMMREGDVDPDDPFGSKADAAAGIDRSS